MDIGPVNAIRLVQALRPSPPGASETLAGVFATEFRQQQRDDSYSPSRKASRGLEDEDEELELEAADAGSSSVQRLAASTGSISFFA